MRRHNPITVLLLLAIVGVILYAAFVALPGANYSARAEAMQTNYYFHPIDGRYYQSTIIGGQNHDEHLYSYS